MEVKRSNEMFCNQLNACVYREQALQKQIDTLKGEAIALKVKSGELRECLASKERLEKQVEVLKGNVQDLRLKLALAQEDLVQVEQKLIQECNMRNNLTTSVLDLYVQSFFSNTCERFFCSVRKRGKRGKAWISLKSLQKLSAQSQRCVALWKS